MSEAPTKRFIRPIRDQILVKQDKPKEKLANGLYVPQGSRDLQEDFGTVIAVGPGKVTINGVLVEPVVKAGDRVLFKRRPMSALSSDWEDMLMLKDEDVLAVIDE